MEALSTKTLELSAREPGKPAGAGQPSAARLFYGDYGYYLDRMEREAAEGDAENLNSNTIGYNSNTADNSNPAAVSTVKLWIDEDLINEAAEWLGPVVWDGAESGSGPVINSKGLTEALAARLGWEKKNELDRLVPEFFNLPKGRRRIIDYSSGEPVLRIRLQDAFGISSAVEILSVPVVFHLLSPADRPIQVTRDLAGFWKGSYTEVRKEMRGRYPKHKWPENPVLNE
jgi:ATP-dependent helicase HrpB